MTDQSIATMTVNELESLITKLIDERFNQNQVLNTKIVDQTQLVDRIHHLQASLKEKYGDFPDSTKLLQQDRATYYDPE
jgi:hypothetical protein